MGKRGRRGKVRGRESQSHAKNLNLKTSLFPYSAVTVSEDFVESGESERGGERSVVGWGKPQPESP